MGQIVITEIMYNPSGSEYDYEWIELHATEDVNIEGWTIDDGSIRAISSYNSGYQLNLGETVIVARDAIAFEEKYGPMPTFESSFSLSNSGKTLKLLDGDKIIDIVEYENIAEEDHSIELISVELNNKDMSSWKEGPLDGTPGSVQESNPDTPDIQAVPEFTWLGLVMIIGIILLKR